MGRIATSLVIVMLATAAGCSHPRGAPAIGNADTDLNVLGIKEAVRDKDLKAAKALITNLSSDDPAIRFYSIRGLKDLTGKTFGYVYYDDDEARKPAIAKWNEWLKARTAAQTQPSGGDGTATVTAGPGSSGGDDK